jgi:hypothetical protein
MFSTKGEGFQLKWFIHHDPRGAGWGQDKTIWVPAHHSSDRVLEEIRVGDESNNNCTNPGTFLDTTTHPTLGSSLNHMY